MMDIAGKARKIERKLARTVDAAIGELVGRDEPVPLEILHAVLDRAEHEVLDIGRGRRVFPFKCIRVHLAGPLDQDAKARFEAVVAGPPSLDERVAERLRSAGCRDAHVVTELEYVKERGDDWEDARYHITFDRPGTGLVESPPPAAPAAPPDVPRLKLTVVKGSADHRAFAFTGGRVDIGRRAEVVDQTQRLIRTNQVAFAEEGADENRTVSRRHAHVEFVQTEGGYRVFDDRSTHGTSIVRGGRTIKVPAGTRGARLEAGDEIALGRARLKVAIDTTRSR